MKFLVLVTLFLGQQSLALDVGNYSKVSCRLHKFAGQQIEADLAMDPDCDPGTCETLKIAESSMDIDGRSITLFAKVSEQPIFSIQLVVDGEYQEVEVIADQVEAINIIGDGLTNAICYFN